MNNKPANTYQSITDTKIEPTVVSYTHPVKELTERIRKLETALQGWEIGFEKMGYERLLKDKDEYIAELLKEPIKELTDEEIDDIGRQHLTDGDGAIEFARAILRKAQE